MARRFYTLLFMLVAAVSVYGYGSFTVDGIKYEYTSMYDGVRVIGVEDTSISGEIVIPETVTNGVSTYSVKTIGSSAFENCTNIMSVILPNSIRAIEYAAFKGCANLMSFNIPSSVTLVEEAFDGTGWYNSQPNGFVYKDNVLYSFKGESKSDRPEGHVDIAEGTRVIASRVFDYCFDLTSVTIPNTVEAIGESAFFQTGITSLTIPASVKSIGEYNQEIEGETNVEIIPVSA